MKLPITAELMEHAYDYLCQLPPFNAWSLPYGDMVHFKTFKRYKKYAHYFYANGVHHIEMSEKHVGCHTSILSTMAHEMIHLHVQHNRIRVKDHHGKAFQRLADQVCAIHGFCRVDF